MKRYGDLKLDSDLMDEEFIEIEEETEEFAVEEIME